MRRADMFQIIKEANQMVDEMKAAQAANDKKTYGFLVSELTYLLDAHIDDRRFTSALRLSKRTGHYYLKFD